MAKAAPSSDRPVALITGASAGIGRVFAQRLARRGCDLLLVARREERLAEIAADLSAEYGVDARPIAADLADPADIAAVADRIRQFGRVEILVNNAGFGTTPLFAEADLATQADMARLHVLAVTHLTHAALESMCQRGRGSIITVSSVAGFFASPSNAMYCATKAWQRFFVEGLHTELAGSGVYVQALCPGFTYSEFHDVMGVDRAAVPKKWWMPAEFVVDASLRAMDRGRWLCIPSWRYKLAVAFARLAPTWLKHRAARKRHTRLRQAGIKSQM